MTTHQTDKRHMDKPATSAAPTARYDTSDLGFNLVRATDAAALSAGRWMGLGQRVPAEAAATAAMHDVLCTIAIDGHIVANRGINMGQQVSLGDTQKTGTGTGIPMDVVLDPVDGRSLLAQGRLGAISVAAVAPRGSIWSPPDKVAYMEKIVVSPQAASALVEECMDAPAAWTLALVARAEGKAVRDLVVYVLDRPRHQALIDEIRMAGARVMLRMDGDISGALMAVSRNVGADLLMGIGGVTEGLIAACAVKAMGGAMLGRLCMKNNEERIDTEAAGFDPADILNAHHLVSSNQIFFAATGISDNPLLAGVRYQGDRAETESLVLRGETGTRRLIHAEHRLEDMVN